MILLNPPPTLFVYVAIVPRLVTITVPLLDGLRHFASTALDFRVESFECEGFPAGLRFFATVFTHEFHVFRLEAPVRFSLLDIIRYGILNINLLVVNVVENSFEVANSCRPFWFAFGAYSRECYQLFSIRSKYF